MCYGIIQGKKYLRITEHFKTDLDCEEYLASLKWEDGIFTASKTHNSKEYTTTQIRRNRRKKQMKKQYMKLLLISLFLIWVWSCKNVVNDNTEKDPLNESLSIESDTISDTKSDTKSDAISDTISNAQEHCDFDSFIKEEMGYLNGGFGSEGRLDLGNINISSMLSKPSFPYGVIPYIGFIDIKIKRRLEINFLKIEKSTTNDSLYIAKGKTKVGKNVRLFEGDIKIKHVYFFAEHSRGADNDMVGKIKSQGIIIADYYFREDKKLSATGIFEGKVLLRWYINNKGVFLFDDIEEYSDDYRNNQFVGTWTSYKTGVKKVANWGICRIPCSGDLDWGAAEFSPAPEYRKYGWEDY